MDVTQLDGESDEAFEALLFYYKQSPPRTLWGAAVAACEAGQLTLPASAWERRRAPSNYGYWRQKFDWDARVAELDESEEARERLERLVELKREKKRLREEEHVLLGLQEKARRRKEYRRQQEKEVAEIQEANRRRIQGLQRAAEEADELAGGAPSWGFDLPSSEGDWTDDVREAWRRMDGGWWPPRQ